MHISGNKDNISNEMKNTRSLEEGLHGIDEISRSRGGDPTSSLSTMAGEAGRQEEKSENESESEYEYVSVREFFSGLFRQNSESMFGSLRLPIMLLALAAIAFLLTKIFQYANAILIAVSFTVMVFLFIVVLYQLWKSKKKAEMEYQHAKRVMEAVQNQIANNYAKGAYPQLKSDIDAGGDDK